MQAKNNVYKMDADDKRRKRQDELNYRFDVAGMLFMMLATLVLGAIMLSIMLAIFNEAVLWVQ